MQLAHHPNLVLYHGARRCAVGVQIVMEYVGGGSLEQLLKQCGTVKESVAQRYTRDILSGLEYLHETAEVCHRDVKPGNILLTPEGRCKLTDFGTAAVLNKEDFMQTTVGTPWYMSPEVISGGSEDITDGEDASYYNPLRGIKHEHSSTNPSKGYTTRADIWSLGVTLYEMLTGHRPYGGNQKNQAAIMFSIVREAVQPPVFPPEVSLSPSVMSFIRLCLVYDHRLRPSAKELLQHPWIAAGTTPTSSTRVGQSTRHALLDAVDLKPPPALSPSGSSPEVPKEPQTGRSEKGVSSISSSDADTGEAATLYESVRRQIEAKDGRTFSTSMLGVVTPAIHRSNVPSVRHGATETPRSVTKGIWSMDGHYVELPR
ncbi:protein kinase [Angomonas deanei]|nr:protein kinase [Angomonas deanei]|eukprot:EPY22167.1 protein kinase [Angomonas deanei]